MRGRAIAAVLLFSLVSPFSLFGQCDQTLRYSAQFRTTAYDVAVDGALLWVATGYGVTLLEEVPGRSPRILDSVALPESTRVIRADGQGIAYAASGSRLHVLRRENGRLHLVRSVAASGTINDIALATYLFVATSAGIDHFSIFDRETPMRTNVSLFTTSPNVSSLAVSQSNLYAADGDASVEIFSIATPSLPQRIGTLEAMPFAAYLNATSTGQLFVSDRFGLRSQLFSGTSRLAEYPFSVTAVAALTGEVHFVAGLDRSVRALDLSVPNRIATLFHDRLVPSGGTDNSIRALRRSGGSLYVAAGDLGLTVYDVAAIARPYPFVSYEQPGTNSVDVQGDRAWMGTAGGTIREYRIDSSGISLHEQRSWNGGASTVVVHDVTGDLLLSSSGATATLWSLAPSTPTVALTATFPDTIAEGVIRDGAMLVRLGGGAIWKAAPSPELVIGGPSVYLTRFGNALARAEVRSDGTTILHYYPTGDLTAEPQRFTFDGAATGGIALDGTRAAIFTFTGISVVDLVTGSVRQIAGSTRAIPRQLHFAGDDLLVLTSNALHVYGEGRVLEREHPLALDPLSIGAAPSIAVIAAAEGPAAISYSAALPTATAPFHNRYYTKAVATDDSLHLFSRDSVESYSLISDAPHFVAHADASGVIDIAPTPRVLLTLTGNGTVTAWSRQGVKLAQTQIGTSSEQPLSITAVGSAAWISVSKGCTAGICEKETIVLDAETLIRTSSMSGGIDDIALSANRAFVLVSLPDQLRVVDTTDPRHPAPLLTTERPPAASSLAYGNGTIHVLGERLRSYTATNLNLTAERLDPLPGAGPQLIRIVGNCAIVRRAGEEPRFYALADWVPSPSPIPLPSTLRSVTASGDRLYLLTDHSLEVWSATATVPPGRRRSAR